MPTERPGIERLQRRRVGAHRRAGRPRKATGGKHGKAGKRQAFRSTDACARRTVTIAPCWPRSGIEEYADNGKVERRPGTLGCIAPWRGLIDLGPTITPADPEMAPTGVQGHIERGIGMPRGCGDKIRGTVEPAKVDAKMREPIVNADCQQSMGPLPHCPGAQ